MATQLSSDSTHLGLGAWSLPPDGPSWVALVVAGVLLAAASIPNGPAAVARFVDFSGLADPHRKRRFLGTAGLVSSLLSLGYIAFYLRGGPRASAAPAYWILGRALSHGEFTWAMPSPGASFRARDVLPCGLERASASVRGGYPLLLAGGFLLGAPMLVGPLIAGGLAVATWFLTREVALAAAGAGADAEHTARLAAGLSIVCAALRYHTADILPYGAAALAITLALSGAIRAERTIQNPWFALTGGALGWLAASIPTWGFLSTGAVCLCLALRSRARARALGWAAAGMAPGLALLWAQNYATTGHALASLVAVRAATLSSGSATPHGAAFSGVLPGLREHARDVANFEPLALLALLLFRKSGDGPRASPRSSRAWLPAVFVVVGQLLAFSLVAGRGEQAHFGGGAASLAAVLPLEHSLIALAITRSIPPSRFGSAAAGALGLSFAGFALHTSIAHEQLAGSGLGRPNFEPDILSESNVTSGLLYFDDDEAYELAAKVSPSHTVQALRLRGDDHDRLAYDALGHPASYRHSASGVGHGFIAPWSPPGIGDHLWRFEAESDWPPAAVTGGTAELLTPAEACVSGGSALGLIPRNSASAQLLIELAVPPQMAPQMAPAPRRSWTVVPRAYVPGQLGDADVQKAPDGPRAGDATLTLVEAPGGAELARWSWHEDSHGSQCLELAPQTVELAGVRSRAWLVLTAQGGAVALDQVLLRPR